MNRTIPKLVTVMARLSCTDIFLPSPCPLCGQSAFHSTLPQQPEVSRGPFDVKRAVGRLLLKPLKHKHRNKRKIKNMARHECENRFRKIGSVSGTRSSTGSNSRVTNSAKVTGVLKISFSLLAANTCTCNHQIPVERPSTSVVEQEVPNVITTMPMLCISSKEIHLVFAERLTRSSRTTYQEAYACEDKVFFSWIYEGVRHS